MKISPIGRSLLAGLLATGTAMAELSVDLETELVRLRIATDAAFAEAGTLAIQIKEEKDAMEDLQLEFADYRKDYRTFAWIEAAGDSFETLTCRDGREFLDVKVSRIDAVGMVLQHRNGAARISHNFLPAELQERFLWDASEAKETLAQEAKESAERERLNRITYSRMAERRQVIMAAARSAEDRRLSMERSRLAALAQVSKSRLKSIGGLGETRSVGRRSYYNSRDYSRSRHNDRPTIYYYQNCYRPSQPSRTTRSSQSYRRVQSRPSTPTYSACPRPAAPSPVRPATINWNRSKR